MAFTFTFSARRNHLTFKQTLTLQISCHFVGTNCSHFPSAQVTNTRDESKESSSSISSSEAVLNVTYVFLCCHGAAAANIKICFKLVKNTYRNIQKVLNSFMKLSPVHVLSNNLGSRAEHLNFSTPFK